MLEELKQKVFKANLDLVKQGLVIFTWGNVSGIDREKGLVVIKPSGVNYDEMKASDMVVVDLETGKVVEGDLNPSSDTPTHLVLYKAFPNIQGVVHTHSTYATAFAQAGKDIPNIGTTHADYFYQAIPCTRDMTKEEVEGAYELETGNVIVDEILNIRKINPDHTPAVLVKNHGPFSWGTSPDNAVYNAKVMEQCAKMAFIAYSVNPDLTMNPLLVEKHYNRKHGPNAYYGQKNALVDLSLALSIAGSMASLHRFMAKESDYSDDILFANDHRQARHFLTDEKALEIFKGITKLESTSAVENLCKVERNRYIRKLRKKGLTVRQVARLMDISETTVKRLCQMNR